MSYLICGNIVSDLWQELEMVLNLNLIYETLWTGAGSGLLISMSEKLKLFCLIALITLVVLMWKFMSLFLMKDHLLRCWGCLYILNWIGARTLSLLLKLPPGLEFVKQNQLTKISECSKEKELLQAKNVLHLQIIL